MEVEQNIWSASNTHSSLTEGIGIYSKEISIEFNKISEFK
jgi:hypothetical protein